MGWVFFFFCAHLLSFPPPWQQDFDFVPPSATEGLWRVSTTTGAEAEWWDGVLPGSCSPWPA